MKLGQAVCFLPVLMGNLRRTVSLECRVCLAEKAGRVSFNLRARKRVRLTFAFSLPQDHEVGFALATGLKRSRDLEAPLRRSIFHQIDWYSANREVNRI